MPLTNCPECDVQVSDTAYRCPSCGFQLRKPKRGFFGKVFKWSFIIFNAFMAFWLFSYFSEVSQMMTEDPSDAYQAGAAVGSALGTSFILGLWVFGDIILGLFVLFTKPNKG